MVVVVAAAVVAAAAIVVVDWAAAAITITAELSSLLEQVAITTLVMETNAPTVVQSTEDAELRLNAQPLTPMEATSFGSSSPSYAVVSAVYKLS